MWQPTSDHQQVLRSRMFEPERQNAVQTKTMPRALTVEEMPYLDVPHFIVKFQESGQRRVAGRLFLRCGVGCHYNLDLGRDELYLRVGDRPRWRYQLLPSVDREWCRIQCNTCHQPAEMLFWVPNRGDACAGEGRCLRCLGLRRMSQRIDAPGRAQLRREIRSGNLTGVLRAMARSPEQWLAGQQALESEGYVERQHTLDNGNTRRSNTWKARHRLRRGKSE